MSDAAGTHTSTLLYHQGRLQPGLALKVKDGLVEEVCPAAPGATCIDHGRSVIVPAPVNVHSHSFQTLIRGPADRASNFRDWVDRYLYPLALAVDEEAVYQGALLAFAEMALNGFAGVGEFFYIHNERGPEFAPGENKFARATLRAATEIGLRTHLLRTMYDVSEMEGQRRFAESVESSVEGCRQLRSEYASHPLVTVGPAPHSLHGASREMIQAGAELAREWDTKLHIHLAEERHDLDYSRRHYGTTPLRSLEQLGVVNERLVIVHGCWLDDEEIELLGERGGGLAYNPASNAALADGVTDMPAMLAAGVTVGLGTDGACANNQQDPWREMRTAEYLQRVQKLEMGIHARKADGARSLLHAGTRGSARNLDWDSGEFLPGAHADFAVLDLDDLSLQPTYGDDPDAVLHNIVYSMSARSAVRGVYVAGKPIVEGFRLVHVDENSLAEMGRRWDFLPA